MIIEVLVVQRQPVDALTQQVHLPVSDQVRVPRVRPHGIQRRDQPQPPVHVAPQQDAAVTGNLSSRKIRLDFPAVEAWKTQFGCGPLRR
jgi:hypothetical protein